MPVADGVTVNAVTAPRTILLKGRGIREEQPALAQITPGMLLMLTPNGVQPHNNPGVKAAPLFALENELFGLGINDVYNPGDNVQCEWCNGPQWVLVLVDAGASAIAVGDFLESAGDGSMRLCSSEAGSAVKATGTSGTSNTEISYTAVDYGTQGNSISVTIATASGAGSVSVVGTAITVTPPAAANTVAQVIAMINAITPPTVNPNSGQDNSEGIQASQLVVASTTGNGTGAPVNSTVTLTSGANATSFGAGSEIAIARDALNNSSASTPAFLRAVLI
jgi:hypothetical protein